MPGDPTSGESVVIIKTVLIRRKRLDKFFIFFLLFSSIKDGFPQQGPRPTCDSISGPRLIGRGG